ncbi:hypothetical protein IWW46_001298, partial [Coemansia sp. RSA 2440]
FTSFATLALVSVVAVLAVPDANPEAFPEALAEALAEAIPEANPKPQNWRWQRCQWRCRGHWNYRQCMFRCMH